MQIMDARLEPAFRLAGGQIGRQLSDAFGQLDAGTGNVETRKLLHALFVQEAILMSHQRFPDNVALIEAIEAALAIVRGNPLLAGRDTRCPA
jgi:hypothetical protein